MMTSALTDWNALAPLLQQFLDKTGHRNDGWWDDGIWSSTPYLLRKDKTPVGFFALAALPEQKACLRAFFLPPEYGYLAQEAFAQVREEYRVTEAMAANNDELFLCLALEAMHAQGGSLQPQAYNFTYGPPRREPEFGPETLCPVTPEDFPLLHEQSENMWRDDPSLPLARFYRLVESGETLGYGSIFPRRLDPGLFDLGNYVLPAHRNRGVGRSLIIQLARLVLADGKRPCAGCWYYNHASIRTLVSSGFLPDIRVFHILLPEA